MRPIKHQSTVDAAAKRKELLAILDKMKRANRRFGQALNVGAASLVLGTAAALYLVLSGEYLLSAIAWALTFAIDGVVTRYSWSKDRQYWKLCDEYRKRAAR